jgi:hypothetical protein
VKFPQRGFLSPAKRAAVGGLFWLFIAWWSVSDLRTLEWSSALLTFAALVLMPLLMELIGKENESGPVGIVLAASARLQLPAAGLLSIGFLQPAGWVSTVLALPWIIFTGLLAAAGILRVLRDGVKPQWALCQNAGLVFIAVGGGWTLADRLGLHPLGFGTDIVQLTAVHFHFAGLVLPIVAGLVLREFPVSRVASAGGWGVLAGVPLVAIGITATQFGYGHAAEFFAALVLAPSAMIIAALQLCLAVQNRWPMKVRVLWSVAGTSLLFGMSLALLYAARAYGLPLRWLDIPWMRALHGTANALGFALCAMIGWWISLTSKS